VIRVKGYRLTGCILKPAAYVLRVTNYLFLCWTFKVSLLTFEDCIFKDYKWRITCYLLLVTVRRQGRFKAIATYAAACGPAVRGGVGVNIEAVISSETPLATNYTKLCKTPIDEFQLDVTCCRLMLHSTGYKLQVRDFKLNVTERGSLAVERTYPCVYIYDFMRANWYERNNIGFIYVIYIVY